MRIGGFGQPRAWANVASGAPVVRVIAMDADSVMIHIKPTSLNSIAVCSVCWVHGAPQVVCIHCDPQTFQGLVYSRRLLGT